MILRLSKQLAGRVKVSQLAQLPRADDPLTDFSAHLFNVASTQYLIVCNTASLYSAVMYARGITDAHPLIVAVLRAVAETMEDDGLLAAYQQRVAPGSGTVRFGKALSRSVTGSMNQLIDLAKLLLAEEDIAPHDIGCKLNDILLSTLTGPDGQSYGKPREAIKRLIDGGG